MSWRARLARYVLSVMEDRARGPAAWGLRVLLALGVPGYWLGLRWARAATRAQRLPCAVVSVGNLTVGGAGKTPVVAWLAQRWQAQGLRVGILTRGYGRRGRVQGLVDPITAASAEAAARYGDEPAWLARRLPGVAVIVGRSRAANARAVLSQRPLDVLLLDDGFQHWALARDGDIVLLDGERPFGNGWLLPLGTLRESPVALRRAHVILVRQAAGAADALEPLRERLRRSDVAALVLPVRYRAVALDEPLTGGSQDVSRLAGASVRLVSAIGRPRAFEALVRSLGAQVLEHRAYPDHDAYTAADLRAWAGASTPLLTTEKDWMRLEGPARATPPAAPLWVLRVVVELVNPDDETLLADRLAGLLRR